MNGRQNLYPQTNVHITITIRMTPKGPYSEQLPYHAWGRHSRLQSLRQFLPFASAAPRVWPVLGSDVHLSTCEVQRKAISTAAIRHDQDSCRIETEGLCVCVSVRVGVWYIVHVHVHVHVDVRVDVNVDVDVDAHVDVVHRMLYVAFM